MREALAPKPPESTIAAWPTLEHDETRLGRPKTWSISTTMLISAVPLSGHPALADRMTGDRPSSTTGRSMFLISEAELDVIEAHFGPLLDELFGPIH